MNFYLKNKTLEIWLSNDEKADPALLSSLKPVYTFFSANKYTVAVFCSGTDSLFENTRDLLITNKMTDIQQKV